LFAESRSRRYTEVARKKKGSYIIAIVQQIMQVVSELKERKR